MSGIVRRLVLRLAEAGVYQPVWTERIGEEWRRNASRIWEIPPEVMAEQWADMNARFPQALERDAQAYEASLRYSDPKDFHVIAAGLARRALRPAASARGAGDDLEPEGLQPLGTAPPGTGRLQPRPHAGPMVAGRCRRMRAAVARIPADYVALGREPEALAATLHRERLYRLKSLVARDAASAEATQV